MTALHTTPLALALALGLLAATTSCAAQAKKPEVQVDPFTSGVEVIADELVAAAERRTDLSSMRLFILQVDEDRTQNPYGRALASHELAAVNEKLEQELMVTLGNRVNLLDVELDSKSTLKSTTEMDAVAKEHGATHALVGSYVRQGATLFLSVRIVETKSLLIVAAARGNVPCDLLGPNWRTADAATDIAESANTVAIAPPSAPLVTPSTARLGRPVTIYPETGGDIAAEEALPEVPPATSAPGSEVAAATEESPKTLEPAAKGAPAVASKAPAKAEVPTPNPVATATGAVTQAAPALPPDIANFEDLPRVDGPAALRLRALQKPAKEKD